MEINLNHLANQQIFGSGKFLTTRQDKKNSTVTLIASNSKFQKLMNDIFGIQLRKISKILNTTDGQKALMEGKGDPALLTQNLNRLNQQIRNINKRLLCGKITLIPLPKTESVIKPIRNDSPISNNAKDLFRLLFVDLIHSENIQKVQPLGTQLKLLEEKLKEFNQTHGTKLGCLKTFHSDKLDPWQTIKITEPTITTIGQISPLLTELNQILFEKYGIQSNGGDDCIVIDGKQKNPPQCFQNDQEEIIYPQLLLSLIDIKRVLGIIPDKASYIQALKDAYRGIIS
jgi:hypothetical protein